MKGAANSDESGTLFECARFISKCARIMLHTAADSKLTKSLGAKELEDLLSGSDLGWIHSLKRLERLSVHPPLTARPSPARASVI